MVQSTGSNKINPWFPWLICGLGALFYTYEYFLRIAPNVMMADLDTWVQNDVLIRNDKIYMNKGIEVRVPYLDQEMIENFLLADAPIY